MHLNVARRGETLCGEVALDGAPGRPFTGWIALTAAIDDLLVDGECRGEAEPPGDGRRPDA